MKSALVFTVCIAAFLVLSGLPARGAAVELAIEGRATAVIVVPDDAGDAERFAAGELQSYIEKISGAKLPVRAESDLGGDEAFISVGRTRLSAAARERLAGELPDAFVVEAVPNGIVLAGGGDSGRSPGTVFAAYDFLERELGCRWLGQGELWEHVPDLSGQRLNVTPVNRFESPALRIRQSKMGRRDPHHWSIKNKVNMASGGAVISMEADWYVEREIEPPPFDVPARSGWHSVLRLMPMMDSRHPEWAEWFTEYPEWFVLKADGARRHRHWCHMNRELNDMLADRLSQILREHPHLEYVQLGENDGYGFHRCQCEACQDRDAQAGGTHETRRGNSSYDWRLWENTVAGLLAETDPGKNLMGVAYASAQEPLDPEVIRPADNVMMELATWVGCRVHGFEHEGGRHADRREWIELWAEVTPAGMVMTDYLNRNSMNHITGLNPRRYVRDMRYLRDLGYIGYRPIIGPAWGGFFTLNKYAALRAAWNPDLDEDELVRDYCDHAFHEASEHMQAFIDMIEASMAAAGCGSGTCISWTLDEARMDEARRHLDAAHAAAAGNEVVEKRLLSLDLYFQNAVLTGPAWRKMLVGAYSRTHDPEKRLASFREGMQRMEAAAAYADEMLEKHEDILSLPGMSRVRVALTVPRRFLRRPSWRERLKSLENQVQREALRETVEELADEDGAEAVAGLIKALREAVEIDDIRAQRAAVRALADGGDDSALPVLREALEITEERSSGEEGAIRRVRNRLASDMRRAISNLTDPDDDPEDEEDEDDDE